MIESNSLDFIFSWDSFVHMNDFVINSYLKEFNRILKPGGHAVIHHSYLYGGNVEPFKNKGGRSNMLPNIFKKLAEANNLKIIKQEIFDWTIVDTISTIKN